MRLDNRTSVPSVPGMVTAVPRNSRLAIELLRVKSASAVPVPSQVQDEETAPASRRPAAGPSRLPRIGRSRPLRMLVAGVVIDVSTLVAEFPGGVEVTVSCATATCRRLSTAPLTAVTFGVPVSVASPTLGTLMTPVASSANASGLVVAWASAIGPAASTHVPANAVMTRPRRIELRIGVPSCRRDSHLEAPGYVELRRG